MHLTDSFMNVPLWVFPLFLVLVLVGGRSTRPRTIRRRQLYILPSVFLALSASQIFYTYPWGAKSLLAWGVPAVLAGVAGWGLANRSVIRVIRNAGTIDLPGTWINLILIGAAFAARLYFGRRLGMDPALRGDPSFYAWVLGTTGIITGYYLGRSGCFLVRYFRSPLKPAP